MAPTDLAKPRMRQLVLTSNQKQAEAKSKAQALIQGYIGPDHKVLNLDSFYSGLWQALKNAQEQGQADSLG
jgi:hypothetical protein